MPTSGEQTKQKYKEDARRTSRRLFWCFAAVINGIFVY